MLHKQSILRPTRPAQRNPKRRAQEFISASTVSFTLRCCQHPQHPGDTPVHGKRRQAPGKDPNQLPHLLRPLQISPPTAQPTLTPAAKRHYPGPRSSRRLRLPLARFNRRGESSVCFICNQLFVGWLAALRRCLPFGHVGDTRLRV